MFPAGGINVGRKDYVIDDDGYYRFPDSGMLVHRWIAEKYVIGRELLPGEVVHHKNGNKLDNHASNLEVMSWEQHETLHKRYHTVKNVKKVAKIAVSPLKLVGRPLGVKSKKQRRKRRWF
jgi:hypothetical protein